MYGSRVDRAIFELAERHCSVVHVRDLRPAGVGRSAIARRIAAGWMRELLPRTYAVGPHSHAPNDEMLCMAAVLWAGPGAAIDDQTAARLLGVWDRADTRIHVAVPGRALRDAPEPFVVHRRAADWRSPAPLGRGRIPIVGFVDLCQQLARTLTKWQLAHVIDRGLYLRFAAIDGLDAAVTSSVRRPWITVLRDAIQLVREGSAGTRSRSEDLLLGAMMAAGIREPLVNVRGALGVPRDEPDFLWLPERLNVEIDGDQHGEPRQAADDAARDEAVRAAGVRVLRISWRAARSHPDEVVQHIARALRGDLVDLARFSCRTPSTNVPR